MRKYLLVTGFVFALPLFSNIVLCQDSLYLIGTITGQSTTEQIIVVKGVGDINGDGYDDFMVSIGFHSIQLYLGSANFDLTPDVIFHYPGIEAPNSLGAMAGIGDVNGDGYNDFLLGGSYDNVVGGKGKVFLYYGGTTIDTVPVMEFSEPWIKDEFGSALQGVGDLNKDGYDDFVIGSQYNWSDEKGRVYLYFGGDTISSQRSITFTSDTISDYFGESVANVGDINDDGYDDLAISAPQQDTEKVFIYHGGMTMDTIPDTVLTSNTSDYDFGRIIKRAGDLNKDGVIDFCIASGNNIFLYLGYNQIHNPIVIKGYGLGAGGDINGDGYDDLIIGSDWKIKCYFGAESIDTSNYLVIDDSQDSLGLTANISIAGDINNDGYDDIFAFAPYWPSSDSVLGKVFIYSYKKINSVKDYEKDTPRNFELYQNYPNPFNPSTTIRYQLSVSSHVELKVYDVLGRGIKTLADGLQKAGMHTITFDASGLSSGVYFYRLTAGHYVTQKSMLLLK